GLVSSGVSGGFPWGWSHFSAKATGTMGGNRKGRGAKGVRMKVRFGGFLVSAGKGRVGYCGVADGEEGEDVLRPKMERGEGREGKMWVSGGRPDSERGERGRGGGL
ncbi:hypothetical protein HAX54_023426, partial [Datura stramonium]|nr:hypothetical protein [Datura stramonium]